MHNSHSTLHSPLIPLHNYTITICPFNCSFVCLSDLPLPPASPCLHPQSKIFYHFWEGGRRARSLINRALLLPSVLSWKRTTCWYLVNFLPLLEVKPQFMSSPFWSILWGLLCGVFTVIVIISAVTIVKYYDDCIKRLCCSPRTQRLRDSGTQDSLSFSKGWQAAGMPCHGTPYHFVIKCHWVFVDCNATVDWLPKWAWKFNFPQKKMLFLPPPSLAYHLCKYLKPNIRGQCFRTTPNCQ